MRLASYAYVCPASQPTLAKARRAHFDAGHADRLEGWIDAMEEELPPLKNFILPGGSRLIATAHLARSTCRRAERRVIATSRDPSSQENPINANAIRYLNRFSDYLFVVARTCALITGIDEILWEQG